MNFSKTACASLGLKHTKQYELKFSLDEVKQAVGKLKLGMSSYSTGMVREIVKKCGDALLYSPVEMVNAIKSSRPSPSEWNKEWIRVKKGT